MVSKVSRASSESTAKSLTSLSSSGREMKPCSSSLCHLGPGDVVNTTCPDETTQRLEVKTSVWQRSRQMSQMSLTLTDQLCTTPKNL